MADQERWSVAQSYEQGYWDGIAAKAEQGIRDDLDFYDWRGDQLVERLNELGLGSLADGSARVVEIGCGPVGVAGFFPAAHRVAVDPLEDFYSSRPALVSARNPEVQYRRGTGEELPAEDDEFDFAMIENCIDHCQDMDAVMNEIRRVLQPGGHLYFTVNSRGRVGYWMHRLIANLKLDPGHPHTFTRSRVERFLDRHGFDIVGLEVGSLWEAWVEDLTSSGLKAKAKAILGVSEYLVSVVAVDRGARA